MLSELREAFILYQDYHMLSRQAEELSHAMRVKDHALVLTRSCASDAARRRGRWRVLRVALASWARTSRLEQVSTSILGRRKAPFSPFLIHNRVPHGFTPRS